MLLAQVSNAGELERSRQATLQLQHALESRIVIEQAKGALSASAGTSIDGAFQVLRAHARNTRQTVRAVARQVVDGDLDPRS